MLNNSNCRSTNGAPSTEANHCAVPEQMRATLAHYSVLNIRSPKPKQTSSKIQTVRESGADYLPVDCDERYLYDSILGSEVGWRSQRDEVLRLQRAGEDLIKRYDAGRIKREQLAEVKLDSEHWKRLYQCLHKPRGIKDNFREYVQALYLQRLIDAANKRMKDVAPSYSLMPLTKSNGFPHLDFLISKNLGQGLR